jgi:hypothetical protein
MVLSSIQSAYDDNMVVLKAFETFASKYASSKIIVYVSGTKTSFFPLKKMGEQGPCWISLETHMHIEINKSFQ